MTNYILAIDQGTTSSRAIIFDKQGSALWQAQKEFPQHFPNNGWVEHSPEDIWSGVVNVCRTALKQAELTAADIAAIGITNQRETTVVWDKNTGEAIHNAIVWQDRRTAEWCDALKAEGHEPMVKEKTGLLLDPYFSATKIAWILDNVPSARTRAENGELLFGTIDTFLLWRLTRGDQNQASHKTDATNASRTLLFNIHSQGWDDELLALFNIPRSMLPTVCDCNADYGNTSPDLLGAPIPIAGIAGDQQAALVGQACFAPGMAKSTYGTGCFMVVNTGDKAPVSQHQLLTTVGYRVNGKVSYALEGSIFIAGAVVQWLRDGLKIITNARETEALAKSANKNSSVYFVPAFTGLGAPYWDPYARGAITGITRDTGIPEMVAAALEAIGYQTRDLLDAMQADMGAPLASLRIDGGMVANQWLVQFLADILNTTVEQPQSAETTALGAAYLAGLQIGWYESLDDIANLWACKQTTEPKMSDEERQSRYKGWLNCIALVQQSK